MCPIRNNSNGMGVGRWLMLDKMSSTQLKNDPLVCYDFAYDLKFHICNFVKNCWVERFQSGRFCQIFVALSEYLNLKNGFFTPVFTGSV